MASISGSVGRNGQNRLEDVRTVQSLINKKRSAPLQPISVDGSSGSQTIAAIEEIQRRLVKLPWPDGRVDPLGKTWKTLIAEEPANAPKTAEKTQSTGTQGNLSGGAWWRANQAKYPNSRQVSDLDVSFRGNVEAFISALTAAGANVIVSSTKRSKLRAYLMHYCYKVAKGLVAAGSVPAEAGVDIAWDHGDDTQSKRAAQEMVNLFNIAYAPSLHSRHIEGKAIDMTITWSGTLKIKNKSGIVVEVGAPRNGDENTVLHGVGATYGLKKLASDPPHWSIDGH